MTVSLVMLRVEEEILTVALPADGVTGDVTDTELLESIVAVGKTLTVELSCDATEATTTAAGNNMT